MKLGRASAAALMLSGLAGVLIPEKVASALELTPTSARGIAETRAGSAAHTPLSAHGPC